MAFPEDRYWGREVAADECLATRQVRKEAAVTSFTRVVSGLPPFPHRRLQTDQDDINHAVSRHGAQVSAATFADMLGPGALLRTLTMPSQRCWAQKTKGYMLRSARDRQNDDGAHLAPAFKCLGPDGKGAERRHALRQ